MTENIKPSETKNNPKNTTEQSKIKLDLLPHFFFSVAFLSTIMHQIIAFAQHANKY